MAFSISKVVIQAILASVLFQNLKVISESQYYVLFNYHTALTEQFRIKQNSISQKKNDNDSQIPY